MAGADTPGPYASSMADPVHPRAPGWYRRLLVLVLVVLVGAPAVAGALWLPPPAARAAGTSRAAPGRAAPSGTSTPSGASVEGSAGANGSGPDASALGDLLGRRAAAVTAGDADAWAATLDGSVTGLRERQLAVFGRLVTLHPASWRYDIRPPDATLPQDRQAALGAPAFLAHVVLAYRLTAGEPEVHRDQHLTLAWRGHWLVAGTDDGPQQRDVWDLGPVTVARGARSVVVAAAAGPVPASRTAAEADEAAARVDAVWGTDWPRTTVVQIPGSLDDMAALLGRPDPGGLGQLAAVTTGERRTSGTVAAPATASAGGGATVGDATAGPATGDLVVVNAQAFSGLTPIGRRAVLTHEFTHVATRASIRTPPPVWVDEGFADYVAYLDTPLTTRDVAADVLASPERVAALSALPADGAFDPAAGDVGPAYAEAWLAMRFVDREGGAPMVVDFFRVAAGLEPLRSWPTPSPVRPALAPHTALERASYEVVGYVMPSFVRRWIAFVRSLATG